MLYWQGSLIIQYILIEKREKLDFISCIKYIVSQAHIEIISPYRYPSAGSSLPQSARCPCSRDSPTSSAPPHRRLPRRPSRILLCRSHHVAHPPECNFF